MGVPDHCLLPHDPWLFPCDTLLPRGGLVSSFHGTSDILGSTLGHIAMEIAIGILDGPGTPGARSLETAPNEEPIGGC